MKPNGGWLRWVGVTLVAASVGATGAALTPEQQRSELRAALSAYDSAMASRHSDPDAAAQQFHRAATGFEALAAAGVRNAALELNLGNTYYRLGEFGRAILHYRRAQRLDPGDVRITHNLNHVRQRVTPALPPPRSTVWHQLFFWHATTSLPLRYWLCVALLGAGWALLIWRLRRRAAWLTVVGIVLIVHGLGLAGSVAWQRYQETTRPPAVLVGAPEVLRLGRGAGYDPALDKPLSPGTELVIVQERAGWVEVELPTALSGWLPTEAVARVIAAAP